MISRVHSSILQGIDAVGCEVEADVVTTANKPDIKLVGLADKAVQESVSRIQAALRNSPDAYRDWPGPKGTINLAPADVKKDLSAYDPGSCRLAGTSSAGRLIGMVTGKTVCKGRFAFRRGHRPARPGNCGRAIVLDTPGPTGYQEKLTSTHSGCLSGGTSGVRNRDRSPLGRERTMRTTTKFRAAAVAMAVAMGSLLSPSGAQIYTTTTTPYPAPPVAATMPEVTPLLVDEQLDDLLAPVALHPDSLLAQILPASTYPLEVVLASQWLRANPQASEAAIDQQNWEQSIKALAHYPTVLTLMGDHAEWTQALGAAFVNQQSDVLISIQRLRQRALEAGTLQTTAEQQVILADGAIQILPANPQVLYVPEYDPQIVYVRHAVRRPIVFRAKFAIGRWLDNYFDWFHRRVAVGAGWHYGWHYVNKRWWPVDRRVVITRGNTFTRVVRTVAVVMPLTRAWAHNAAKPRPILPLMRVLRRPGPPNVRVTPIVIRRPSPRIIGTRTPARTPQTTFGHITTRSEVERGRRRAEQSRSSWRRPAPVVRPAPVPIRVTPTVAPKTRAAGPTRAPKPAPARTRTVAPKRAPQTPSASSATARRGAFSDETSRKEADDQSRRGRKSLRR